MGCSRQVDSFHNDLHKNLKADFILANPPFNMSDWGGERLREDARWKHGYVLTPGRYVGAAEIEDDGVPFEEKMAELSATLYEQFAEADQLEATIKKNLEVLGCGVRS